MSATFDGPRLTRSATFRRLPPDPAVTAGPERRAPSTTGALGGHHAAGSRTSWHRAARSALRRVPLVTVAAVAATVVVVAVWRGSEPLLAAVAVVVGGWRVGRDRRPAGASVAAAVSATARGLLVVGGAAAVVLHVLDAPAALVDDALVIGTATAVVGAAAAALVAHRARPPRVVVVGDLAQVRGLVARWLEEESAHVLGALVLDSASDAVATGLGDLGVPSVGTSLDDVVAHVERHAVDLVVVAPGLAAGADEVRRLSWALETSPAQLALVGPTEQVAPHRIDVEVVAGSTMTLVRRPRAGVVGVAVKELLDRVGGTLLTLAALPVVAVAALAVRLDSPGPAFFTQTRVGRDGRPFTIYKLRTMHVDAEERKATLAALDEGNGILFKMADDPRVTRVGRLLRSTSLDELPQLFNVVRGDMSLVGPRPALPDEVARYTDDERRRLAVKPGITGLWQVSGRSSLSRHRSMLLDTFYADNWRPSGDALILLRTLDAVVTRRGAF